MSDQDQTNTADTGEGEKDDEKKKEQTVTAEQFVALQKQLEQITAAQSGSDKKVAELTKALTEAQKAKDETAKTAEERIAELEKTALDSQRAAEKERLRTFARGILDEASIKPPKFFDRLIGNDEETTKQWVADFIQDEKERDVDRNKKFDRENGRVVNGPEEKGVDSWDKLLGLTEEQMRNLGPQVVARLTREAREKSA